MPILKNKNKPKFFRIPLYTMREVDNMPKQDVLVNQNTLIPEILIRLQMQINLDDECVFSIDNLITKCGYTPQTGKGRSIDLFRQALQIIQDHGFINSISFGDKINFSNVRTSTLLTCTYNENLEVNEHKEATNYCTIDFEDYLLMSKNAVGSSLRNMINVYCYLSSKKLLSVNSSAYSEDKFTTKKESIRPVENDIKFLERLDVKDMEYINKKDFSKSDFYRFGYSFAPYEKICEAVSVESNKPLSRATLSNVLKQLADLGIIYYGNINDYLDINTIKKPCNIYAFTAHGFYTGLKMSFAIKQNKNKEVYSEELRAQFLRSVISSLQRGEHHMSFKEGDL